MKFFAFGSFVMLNNHRTHLMGAWDQDKRHTVEIGVEEMVDLSKASYEENWLDQDLIRTLIKADMLLLMHHFAHITYNVLHTIFYHRSQQQYTLSMLGWFCKKSTLIAVICITWCTDDEVKIELEAIGGLVLG